MIESRRDPTRPARVRPRPKLSGSVVREAVFGINDGLVATVGLVSGEVLSGQPRASVLIAALSAVGANMVSMAIGSYLASLSQNDLFKKEIRDQRIRIQRQPSTERRAVEAVLGEMGVSGPLKPRLAAVITDDQRRWLRFMVRERLGLHENRREKPTANATVMAIGVLLGSTPPVLPFLLPMSVTAARNAAWILSLAAAGALGGAKGRLTGGRAWLSALQFMLLAGASAMVGAGIGFALGHRILTG